MDGVAVGELAARLAFVHIQSEPAVLVPGNSGRVQGIHDKGLEQAALENCWLGSAPECWLEEKQLVTSFEASYIH